jgi:hypothetical protein
MFKCDDCRSGNIGTLRACALFRRRGAEARRASAARGAREDALACLHCPGTFRTPLAERQPLPTAAAPQAAVQASAPSAQKYKHELEAAMDPIVTHVNASWRF